MASSDYCLHIQSLHPNAAELYSSHGNFYSGDAGLDLFVPEDTIVPANARGFILRMGIATEMLKKDQNISYYLYPRSSMGVRTTLRLANSVGIIDAGYRGQIGAILDNLSDKDIRLAKGEKIVQICLPNLKRFSFQLVDALSSSDRGENGMGSTSTPKQKAE